MLKERTPGKGTRHDEERRGSDASSIETKEGHKLKKKVVCCSNKPPWDKPDVSLALVEIVTATGSAGCFIKP